MNSYHETKATPENLEGAVSKSLLWQFAKSPAKWYHGMKFEPTKVMNFGSLVHCLLLTPENFARQYATSSFDNFRTKAAQEWRDSMIEQGITIIKEQEYMDAHEMVRIIKEDKYWDQYDLACKELVVKAEIRGIEVKGMIDFVPAAGATLFDLKTCSTIGSMDDVTRTVLTLGYHWQAALYLDLYNAQELEDVTRFIFTFIETTFPFDRAHFELSPELIELGREEYLRAINLWKKCKETGVFPSKHEGVITIDKPKYYKPIL